MKPQLCICLIFIFFDTALPTEASDAKAVYSTHLAWKTALEDTDFPAVDAIWTHAPDAIMVTVFGNKIEGWQQISKEILKTFKWVGKSQMVIQNLVITVRGNTASATADYQWRVRQLVLPNLWLKATERYRLEDGKWKIHAHDGTGKVLLPLRPDDETRILPLVQKIHSAIAEADIDKLLPLIADNDFTYVALNATVDHRFSKAIVSDDLAKIQKVHLDVVYLIDEVAQAHLTLSLVGNNEQKAQFVIKDFQLTRLDFAPKPLAVMPFGQLTTTWAKIKERSR